MPLIKSPHHRWHSESFIFPLGFLTLYESSNAFQQNSSPPPLSLLRASGEIDPGPLTMPFVLSCIWATWAHVAHSPVESPVLGGHSYMWFIPLHPHVTEKLSWCRGLIPSNEAGAHERLESMASCFPPFLSLWLAPDHNTSSGHSWGGPEAISKVPCQVWIVHIWNRVNSV